MDVFIQYALAAAQFAVDDARLTVTPAIADQVGVFIASGIGGFSTIEREHNELLNGGPRRISPFFIPASIINLAAGQVSIRFGARGPNLATCTACTASAHAIGEAFGDHPPRRRRRDDRRRIGGVDHADGRRRVRGDARAVDAQRRADAREPAVRQGSRRLRHRRRRGHGHPRGARDARSARGASIYAEIVGYGLSGDAYHLTGAARGRQRRGPLDADGAAGRPASRPTQIDYINAHGTSTPINDPTETLAVKTTLRRARVQARDVVDEVDDGPPARRRRRARSRHHGARGARTRSRRRRSTSTSRIRPATSTTRRTRSGRCAFATRCRTRSASAARTARSCSRDTRHESRHWAIGQLGIGQSARLGILPDLLER